MLPKELSYFVNKLSQSSRKTVRLTPQSSQTINRNSQFTIRFPENSIIDLNNFNLRFNFTLTSPTSGGNAVVFVPAAYKLWRQINWRLNGQSVSMQNCSDYNILYHAMKISSVGEDYVNSHKLQGEQLLTGVDDGNQLLERNVYDDYLTDSVSSRRMICNDWLGLGRCPNYIDTSIFGTLELIVQTAGNEIMKSQANSGTTPNVDWQLTDVEATCDCIELPQEYDDVVSAMLSAGQMVEIPFQDVYTTIDASAGSARFNISSQSLDAVLWAPLTDSYNSEENMVSTTGDVGSNATYESNHFRFRLETASDTAVTLSNANQSTAYWRIQNQVYPSYGETGALDWLQITNDAVLGKDVYGHNLLCVGNDSTANPEYRLIYYPTNNCVGFLDLTVSGAGYGGERVMSGLDTRNQSSQIELVMRNFYSGNFVLLAGICTSTVQASAGQVVMLNQ